MRHVLFTLRYAYCVLHSRLPATSHPDQKSGLSLPCTGPQWTDPENGYLCKKMASLLVYLTLQCSYKVGRRCLCRSFLRDLAVAHHYGVMWRHSTISLFQIVMTEHLSTIELLLSENRCLDASSNARWIVHTEAGRLELLTLHVRSCRQGSVSIPQPSYDHGSGLPANRYTVLQVLHW
ncbi:hypothetical protein F4859DRAFT_312604 [Xylaria cf. heliscus]|nr:hypothetical protein F4859DRAFT_312604 [Xylaria cf. heliscus]